MGLWHGVEYYEKEKVVGEEFYQQWNNVSFFTRKKGKNEIIADRLFHYFMLKCFEIIIFFFASAVMIFLPFDSFSVFGVSPPFYFQFGIVKFVAVWVI